MIFAYSFIGYQYYIILLIFAPADERIASMLSYPLSISSVLVISDLPDAPRAAQTIAAPPLRSGASEAAP